MLARTKKQLPWHLKNKSPGTNKLVVVIGTPENRSVIHFARRHEGVFYVKQNGSVTGLASIALTGEYKVEFARVLLSCAKLVLEHCLGNSHNAVVFCPMFDSGPVRKKLRKF